jgi:hypothetical protein
LYLVIILSKKPEVSIHHFFKSGVMAELTATMDENPNPYFQGGLNEQLHFNGGNY